MKHWAGFLFLLFTVSVIGPVYATEVRAQIIKNIEQIRKADYEGDRKALKQFYEQLSPYAYDKDYGSRVRYWRGFALWRRAINGFNETFDRVELEQDLIQAMEEFQKAVEQDPGFVDAKIGKISCMGFLGYLNRENKERVQEILVRASEFKKEIMAEAPDNPRLIWVMGPWLWNTPVERGGGQANAIAGYEKALESMRNRRSVTENPLEVSWGEPELLMSLAWSHLNRTEPDLNAAEEYARTALKLVPYWHYVRDILMPQIQDAKAKANAAAASD